MNQPSAILQNEKSISTPPTLCIRLLGDFQLSFGHDLITGSDLLRMRSLLAYLVLHSDAPQERSQLAFQLWPDSTDVQALGNLRTLVHRLRHTLPDADNLLRVERQELQWQPRIPWTLDVLEFERAAAQAGRSENPEKVRQALEEAVALYRGDLLPSCYEEWVLPERDRLHQVFLSVLERLIKVLEQERNYPAALRAAQTLLHHDPLQEETYRSLMRLHAINGDRSSALRVYHSCVTILEREFGVAPGQATRQLYEHLKQMKDVADRERIIDHASTDHSQLTAQTGRTQLVGRQQEWLQVQSAWRSAVTGKSQLLLLSGEAGIGKTRLAEELLSWVGRQGISTATARCYAAEGELAYAPIVTWLKAEAIQPMLPTLADAWLTEVARLVPDVLPQRPELSRPVALTENWQRQRLFEALAHALLDGRQSLVLLLDDIQWCDSETLAWIHYLLHVHSGTHILLVATVRPTEVSSGHPLASLLLSLQREEQVTEVELGPLSAGETAILARQVGGQEVSADLAERLYRETEGNALFVVETMRTNRGIAQDDRQLSVNTHNDALHVPATVQSVIAARLAQLSPLAREIVGVAAVIGRAFTFAVLASACTMEDERLVLGLDELWQRGIVREQGNDGYDFTHDKLREGSYAALSTARKRLLHRRVAEALESIHAHNLDAVSGQLAAHYEQAGLFQQALASYQRAAEAAQDIYANNEALALLQRALRLLETAPSAMAQQWRATHALLLERMGDILALLIRYAEARDVYRQALPLVLSHEDVVQARLQRKIAKTWEAQRSYQAALRAYREAESRLGQKPTELALEWWQEWIEIQHGRIAVHYWLAEVAEMATLIEETWIVVEQYGTPELCAAFFLSLAEIDVRRNLYIVSEETLRYASIALAAYQEVGIQSTIGLARYNLGFFHLLRDELAESEEQLQEALMLSRQTNDLVLQSQCLALVSLIQRKRGYVAETLHICEQVHELAMATQRPEDAGMAKANMAWAAWREGNVVQAQEYGHAALQLWQQTALVYPFHWLALCPLLAVALAQGRCFEAITVARMLLAPDQQCLPPTLGDAVAIAIQTWDDGQLEVAQTHIQRVLLIAQELGYL